MAQLSTLERYFSLKGRRAVVTGAGRGLGRAIAEGLAGAGAEVCVHYNTSKDAAQEVVAGIQKSGGTSWSAGADLTDSGAVNRFFGEVRQRWGGALDILVNNAGDLIKRSPVVEADDALIDKVMKVNVYSAIYCCRAAIPLLQKGTNAVIVNVSSVAAHNGGAGGAAMYAASKGAVLTLTRGLAKEIAPMIRVNALAPGVHLTDFHRTHSTEERLKAMEQSTPMKRLGTPDDCTAATIFLCGAGGAFVTGEMIEINGGIWVA